MMCTLMNVVSEWSTWTAIDVSVADETTTAMIDNGTSVCLVADSLIKTNKLLSSLCKIA